MSEKKREKSGKYSYRGIVGLCILGLVAVLDIIFAAYAFFNYRNDIRENAAGEAMTDAAQAVSLVDERLDNLMNYYLNEVTSTEIQYVLENQITSSDYSHYHAAMEALRSPNLFADYISGFTFVNFRTEWVLCSKGMYTIDEVLNPGLLYELFEENNDSVDKNYWFYDGESEALAKDDKSWYHTVETTGLNLVMKLPNATFNVYAMLMVSVNMTEWQSWLSQWVTEAETVVVLDQEGNLIYAADDRAAESVYNLQLFGADMEDGAARSTTVGNTTYMASKTTSGILGWEYYVLCDISAGSGEAGMNYLLLAMSLIILTVCGYLITSSVIYRPVGRLVEDISGGDSIEQKNELDFVASSFTDLKNDKVALEDVVRQQSGRVKELFGFRLMRGEISSEDEWKESLESMGLSQWKRFAAAVIVLDLRTEDETDKLTDNNEDVICLKMVEEMPESLAGMTWIPPMYNACAIFCFFAGENEDELLDKILDFYRQMQEYARENFGFGILMGVSASHTEYRHSYVAYKESIHALTMGEKEKPGNGRETEEEEGTDSCYFYLPGVSGGKRLYNSSFEKEMHTAVKALDKEQCYRITDEFTHFLGENDISQDETTLYLIHFANAILVEAVEARVSIEKIYPEGLRRVYRELIEAPEQNRVRRYIKWKIIDPVINERLKLLEDDSYSMLEKIEKMIRDHKGNITMTECADALGVHPTYIWKVLKMEESKNFSDYVEEYKLEEAKRLLSQTNMTVADIATELGYNNAQNFIRFFSKSTGVTPGKFRKLY
ncbi:MAG: helix-turn-helix transcriptional regulator [Lachnospiraceae bacterium]|nr:helix-turn-helix transcriptional regulator [Lachnospiraceae bacterium]